MLKKIAVLFITAGIFSSVITSCSGDTATEEITANETTGDEMTKQTTGESEDIYCLNVYIDDELKASFVLNDLLALEQVTLITPEQDSDQQGPTLLSVLDLAGVGDYSEILVVGLTRQRIATAELTLIRHQIDKTVVLDISNRGTTKLCGTNIPSEEWIRDVSELRIR